MACEVTVMSEHRLGLLSLFGTVTGDTIVEASMKLCMSDEWKPGYDTLWDGRMIRSVSVSPIEAADILDQARHLEDRVESGRTAAVVRDVTDYALAHMLFLKADNDTRERKAFLALGAAIRWLGLQDKRFDNTLCERVKVASPGSSGSETGSAWQADWN